MLNIFVILNLIENFKCNRKQFYENDKFLKLLLKKEKSNMIWNKNYMIESLFLNLYWMKLIEVFINNSKYQKNIILEKL